MEVQQSVSQDILRATESVRDCVDVLLNFRSGDVFDRLCVQAEEVQMPRITNRQRHRPNLPADSALVYYRRVLFNPILDTFIVQLQECFVSTSAKALLLSELIPTFCLGCHFSAVEEGVTMYLVSARNARIRLADLARCSTP